jgi:glycerol-3-phosphate O-acyltransferase/dihydroxyacetone phosphate acyltransferase
MWPAFYRLICGLALRLYYRHVEVSGVELIPAQGPVLLVANHPNALVDALLVLRVVPRRVSLTAKATLFANPAAAQLLRWIGVIPLRRASDERGASVLDPQRNVDSFRAIIDALAAQRALLIFPEGKSHDEPAMARLRTGAARMALQARDTGRASGLAIVPIGLNFTRKEAPRSTVVVEVGDPIHMDDWEASSPDAAVEELTDEITIRLRAVTLNFASLDDAAQATALGAMIARLLPRAAPDLDTSGKMVTRATTITRRIEAFRQVLPLLDAPLRERVVRFADDVMSLHATLRADGQRIQDVAISSGIAPALRFAVREALFVSVAGPVALWGQINHWVPFRAARAIAMRSVGSAADPAMRTIVAGAALLLIVYAVQGALVGYLLGPVAAVLYLVSLPLAAQISLRLTERLRRALRRARSYLRFRRKPALQRQLLERVRALREEALALDDLLTERSRGAAVPPGLRSSAVTATVVEEGTARRDPSAMRRGVRRYEGP